MKNVILGTVVMLSAITASAHKSGRSELSHHRGYQPVCATLVNTEDPYRRVELNILNTERIADLAKVTLAANYYSVENWDNQVSAIEVKKGCTVTAYQYKNFNINLFNGQPMNGFVVSYDNEYSEFTQKYETYGKLNNTISSLSCTCK